ncbi:MAG: GNAT family N-acetyltransferase [Polaromonas sp.]|uniref:GNAT family N-acetyltransferase n=1 Tax=Polaromonas sp. TaxID=1869339 RepID=UPI00273303C0|nr:GNAT family N-acetyltransferase [Polaromonas sp.]MDP2818036.1 GNAT family N-acetyltransferase [Polaromonas sp.]
MTLVISALERHHDRNDFDCGEAALNHFLQRLARQHADKDFNRTYVAVEQGEAQIRGFYAISSASIDFENWPAALRLPRYPVPVVRIGRLGVDLRAQGKGIGVALLRHAMHLAASTAEKIGLFAVVVDAQNKAAASFYARYGFQSFPDRSLSLFLMTDVFKRALAASRP